jgi:hypothetical protein
MEYTIVGIMGILFITWVGNLLLDLKKKKMRDEDEF